MAIEKVKIRVLNKLFDKEIRDEKAIAAIGLKELVDLKLTPDETAELFDLQNAVKKNKVISYLAGEQDAPKREEQNNNSYMGY